MPIRPENLRWVLLAPIALALLGSEAAWGEDAKATSAKWRFVESSDPAVPPDTYKVLKIETVSTTSDTVEAEACSSHIKISLVRKKIFDVKAEACPNRPPIPGSFPVIAGKIKDVTGNQVTIAYPTTGGTGIQTFTMEKNYLTEKDDIKSGNSVIFYPSKPEPGIKTEHVVKDFKIFENALKKDPAAALKQQQFRIQIQQ